VSLFAAGEQQFVSSSLVPFEGSHPCECQWTANVVTDMLLTPLKEKIPIDSKYYVSMSPFLGAVGMPVADSFAIELACALQRLTSGADSEGRRAFAPLLYAFPHRVKHLRLDARLGVKDYTVADGVRDLVIYYGGVCLIVGEDKMEANGHTLDDAVTDLSTKYEGTCATLCGDLPYILGLATCLPYAQWFRLSGPSLASCEPVSPRFNVWDAVQGQLFFVSLMNVYRWAVTVGPSLLRVPLNPFETHALQSSFGLPRGAITIHRYFVDKISHVLWHRICDVDRGLQAALSMPPCHESHAIDTAGTGGNT
jgi:hypothetical protein